MQKERGSNSSKMTFLCPTSTLCGEKQCERESAVPRHFPSQADSAGSTGSGELWGPLSLGTMAGSCNFCMLGHICFQPEHLQGFGQRQSPQYLLSSFLFFPPRSESRAEGGSHHAETTTHTPLNLVALLSQDNIPQSHHLLPAYPCALSVCWHTHCKCAGAGTVLLQTQSLLGAILLSGYCPLWNCRQ